MSHNERTPSVYNIAPGTAFADALVSVILEETKANPEALTQYKIMLPTRRACRHIRDAFLRLTEGKPLLLPRLQTIGDIDEDELMLDMAGSENADLILSLPPALDPIKRQIQIARLVSANENFVHSPDHALKLAQALGQLLDQIYNENLDMADLVNIVPEDFADHWQITLEFLKIISQHWPLILEEQGVIDAVDRRNRLIHALADHWSSHPPQAPIIAAGSTGSMPATARLLKAVSYLPNGRLILPGLDCELDEQSWQLIDDTHPQATLKNLLDEISIVRADVKNWGSQDQPQDNHRNFTMRELMRPADTTEQWRKLADQKDIIQNSLENITLHECATQEEEAQLISILMRETLENPSKTAALITPDRILAKRVTAACKRWNINVDDSAGTPLIETDIGSFLNLSIHAVINDFSPTALLSFLRHPFVKMNISNTPRTALINALETEILRGPAPQNGFEGIYKRISAKIEEGRIQNAEKITDFVKTIEAFFTELSALQSGTHHFQNILKAHIRFIEHIADRDQKSGADMLWAGDDGETAAQLLSNLIDQTQMPDCTIRDYAAILEHFMGGVTVRSPYGVHPRLYIYGQLEARMIRADRVIMASLNEGTWPPNPSVDPWMSRPMRTDFGLPSYERSVGLSAHDFALGFAANDVIITRAKNIDGAPTIPARWLERLDTVLQAATIDPQSIRTGHTPAYLNAMNDCPHTEFIKRPEPRPPVDKRPHTLSVTAIEKWMRDPYSVYARYILRLRKLDPLEDNADAALRGNIIHKALEMFLEKHPNTLPPDALDILLQIGENLMQEHIQDQQLYAFWKPRFDNLARWFVDHEKQWRQNAVHILTEEEGTAALPNGFKLKAKADRIDRIHNDGAAIIDYKTGGIPTNPDVLAGYSPQMPLEGLIIAKGGFPQCGAMKPQYLGFWHITGNKKAGEEKPVKIDDFDDFMISTEAGITNLIDTFRDPQTPYYSLPRPAKSPPEEWQDYAHLARVQEWVALDDSAEDAA